MDTMQNSVMVVDDDIVNLRALVEILSEEYTVYAEREGKNCLDAALRIKPDLILMDVLMPDMDGFEVIQVLKENDQTRNIPVIFVTGFANVNSEVLGFKLGAVDYIVKPYSEHVVRRRVKHQMRIINLLRKVQNLSVTDTLTGMESRRSFNELMLIEWARAKRQQESLGFLLLNIDDFKKFNDSYGYLNGDTALKSLADIIDGITVRATDRVARWGGEEFAVLLPATNREGTIKVAERILTAVENTPITLDNGGRENITVSIGANSCVPDRDEAYSPDDFAADTDDALHKAKKSGKNCICVAEKSTL